jgi:hypothetical protein
MDSGYRSPLIDIFRRGEAHRDVRLLAAMGILAPAALEQVVLLLLLLDDPDPEVARHAAETIDALPESPLRAFLARTEVPDTVRAFFAARGIEPAAPAAEPAEGPLVDTLTALPAVEEDKDNAPSVLSSLPVLDRIKLAMKGTREQRAVLVRDSNKIVATAVLSSPKLTDTEVEAFAKMGNVSEEVLRIIGTNRSWLKNYGVALALTRNPKTPHGISMQLLSRLVERDMKLLASDRNVPEVIRLAARRHLVKSVR